MGRLGISRNQTCYCYWSRRSQTHLSVGCLNAPLLPPRGVLADVEAAEAPVHLLGSAITHIHYL